MPQKIPFVEGEYLVEKAYLVAPDNTAVALQDPVVEVFLDPLGQRVSRGRARVVNVLMVELHEDHDDLDIVLDFGEEFKYRLKTPQLKSGKVFSPDTKSMLQFVPTGPWQPISQADYEALLADLKLLDG
jgi:hypothetical protein